MPIKGPKSANSRPSLPIKGPKSANSRPGLPIQARDWRISGLGLADFGPGVGRSWTFDWQAGPGIGRSWTLDWQAGPGIGTPGLELADFGPLIGTPVLELADSGRVPDLDLADSKNPSGPGIGWRTWDWIWDH